MTTPTQLITVTEALALRVERKQSQRLTIASTVSITANAVFLVLAATAMNRVNAASVVRDGKPNVPPVEIVTIVPSKKDDAQTKKTPERETPRETKTEIAEPLTETVTKPQPRQQHTVTTVEKRVSVTPASKKNMVATTTEDTVIVEDTNTVSSTPQNAGSVSIADDVAGVADAGDFVPATVGASGTMTAPHNSSLPAVTIATGVGLAGMARGSAAHFGGFAGNGTVASGVKIAGGGRPSFGNLGGGNNQAILGEAAGNSGMSNDGGVTTTGVSGTPTHTGARVIGTGGYTATDVGGDPRDKTPIGFTSGSGFVNNPNGKPGGKTRGPVGRENGIPDGSGNGKVGTFAVNGTGGDTDIDRRNTYGDKTVRTEPRRPDFIADVAKLVQQKPKFQDNTPIIKVEDNNPTKTDTPSHTVALPTPGGIPQTGTAASQPSVVTPLVDARIVAKAKPTITEDAKAAGVRPVRVLFTIKSDNTATFRILASSGNAEVDAAVLQACAKYRWAAATHGGNPVVSTQSVTFDPNE